MAAYRKTSRHPTKVEMKLAEAPGKWHHELGHDLFNGVIVMFPFLILGMLMTSFFPATEKFLPWVIAVGFGLGVWTVVYFRRVAASDPKPEPLERVDIEEFHVVDVLEVEEFEDEGRHLFLKLHDGETLFLTGQYLYEDPDETEVFLPSTRLERQIGQPSDLLLGSYPKGEELRPNGLLPHSVFDAFDPLPGDGDLLKIDFDALKP